MICYRDFTRLAKSTAKVMISFENWNKKAENFHSRLSFFYLFVISFPIFYFAGISVRSCLTRFQKGATQLIWQRSLAV